MRRTKGGRMTAPVIYAFVVGPLILLLVGIFAYLAYLNRSPSRLAEGLDPRWKARAMPGSTGDLAPLIDFDVDGVGGEAAFLRFPSATRVRLNGSNWRRLRAVPRTMSATFRTIVGASEVCLSDDDFDSLFLLEASDAAWARKLLVPDIRRQLVEIRIEGLWRTDVLLDIGSAGITLRIGRRPKDAATLDGWLSLAAAILDRARALSAPDVEISPAELRSGSGCPVCGHPVEGGTRCGSCGTPHHAECWTYSGGCALFGCDSRKAAA
jgi:hypothetical protein